METTRSKTNKILLGAHFSIAGGLHKAVLKAAEYKCPVLQVFTKNANTWKERRLSSEDVEPFLAAKQTHGISSICAHTAYLLNLASPEKDLYIRSVKALEQELIRASELDIAYVIMHPGAHVGAGEEKGLKQIARGVKTVLDRMPDTKCRLLFEATAGQGSSLGHTFEQLARLAELVDAQEKIGFCVDTCHIFTAGYDIRTKTAYGKTMRAFDRIIGLDRLFVMHLNDSKKGLSSRVDRHEHIGEGAIGREAFRFIMNDKRLRAVPKIIETPKKKGHVDYDPVNLKRLRSLVVRGK